MKHIATFLLLAASCLGQTQLTVAPAYVTTGAITINSPTIIVGATVQAVAILQPSLTDVTALCSVPGPNTVTWGSSAPSVATVSATGLITGVSGGTANVTCTLNGITGTGVVTVAAVPYITNPTCGTPPCPLPNGTNGTAYNFTFQEMGGVGSVTWSVTSGAIPGWATLNSSTGALTGTPNVNATTSFTIHVVDSASNAASLAVTLTVATGGACGPPNYPCDRIDLLVQKLPATLPSVGGLVGINNIVSDTLGNGNRIVRVTDSAFNPAKPNKSYVSAGTGSGDENLWSRNVGNHYLICINDSGSLEFVIDFNSSTFQMTRPYASAFPSTGGITIGAQTCEWGHTNNRAFLMGTVSTSSSLISYFDFTDWLSGPQTTPPTATGFFDFTENTVGLPNYGAGNCLPTTYANPTWEDEVAISNDDQTYGSAFSIAGGQGTGTKVAVYRVGSGCSTLDLNTGVVKGDWGSQGTATIPGGLGGFTVHNMKLSKGGDYMIIACTKNCPVGISDGSPFLWQVGTLNITLLSQGLGQGHWTEGYINWINGSNSPTGQRERRPWTNPSSFAPIYLTSQIPSSIQAPFGFHANWSNNTSSSDNQAYLEMRNGLPVIGVVNTTGTTMNWITGHVFSTSWSGSVDIGGVAYSIANCASTIVCTLSSSAGSLTGASYAFPSFTYGWEEELDMVFPNSGIVAQGTTVRVAQCLNSGDDAGTFDAAQCIAGTSQDGKYFIWATDWYGSLGSTSGASSCTTTSGASLCRADDFVGEIR